MNTKHTKINEGPQSISEIRSTVLRLTRSIDYDYQLVPEILYEIKQFGPFGISFETRNVNVNEIMERIGKVSGGTATAIMKDDGYYCEKSRQHGMQLEMNLFFPISQDDNIAISFTSTGKIDIIGNTYFDRIRRMYLGDGVPEIEDASGIPIAIATDQEIEFFMELREILMEYELHFLRIYAKYEEIIQTV